MGADPSRTALGQDEIISLLDQAKYLYLRHLSEPEENSLRLLVEEAIADPTETVSMPDAANPFAEIRKGASPIKSVEGCRTFELRWTRYVAYLVTEEVVGSAGSGQDEVYTGNVFRVYTKSHFLDHLTRDTGGHNEPILHYKLVCQNHLIDVASYSPPEVRLLGVVTDSDRTEPKPN
ncbi:MAG: hypothetical protein K6U09_11195 [Acidobacteriia bacterium]|jgi:hypothetical protein|nr:hypothetical protein [Terriglobia bacterium]